jgi:Polyketide cyclase / dehydrase and lipid transport
MPTPQGGRVSIDIAAPPDVIYDLIADIARMGEWSPECYKCEWLDGANTAAAGTVQRSNDFFFPRGRRCTGLATPTAFSVPLR